MSIQPPEDYGYTPPFPPPDMEPDEMSDERMQAQGFQPGWPPGPRPPGPPGVRPPVGWLPERWGKYQWPFWGWWGYRLRNAWQDVKYLTDLIQDIIVGMISSGIIAPGPNSPVPGPPGSTGIQGPIIGVTDGSDAAPGQVGEFLNFDVTGTHTDVQGPGTGQVVVAGVMPPGDWDVWASVVFGAVGNQPGSGTTFSEDVIQGCNLSLRPKPTGFSSNMYAQAYTIGLLADVTANQTSLTCPTVRASLTTPTLLAFWLGYNDVSSDFPNLSAGAWWFNCGARRRR